MAAPQPLRLNNQPLYLQAIDALRAFIEEEKLKPGDVLPSEDALAHRLGVSRLTLREAMGYLENDGLVERRRGVGTFVNELSRTHFAGGLERMETLRSLARSAGLRADTVSHDVEVTTATDEQAARLDLEPGAELVRVQTTQAIGGANVAHFDGLAPLELVDLARLEAGDSSLLEYFLEFAAQPPIISRSLISAVNAGPTISRILGISEGAAVLRLDETFYLASHRPVVWADNYFLTDSFNFYIARRARGGAPQRRVQD